MHIAFVIMAGGGAEAFVQTLLPEFERRGHRVSVIYGHSPRPGQAAFPLRVPVAYAPAGQWHYYLGRIVKQFHAWPRRLRSWEVSRAAGRVLAEMEITSPVDVIDVMEGLPVPPLRARGRVVVRAYGSDWTVRHYCRDGDRYGDRWLIRQEAAILRAADGVTAISQHLAAHLSRMCRFPLERIHITPCPIDIKLFAPAGPAATELSLLSVGRLERRKGMDVLVRVLGQVVWPRYPTLKVYLLGAAGDLTPTELLALAPPRYQANLVFPGFVPRHALPNYYRRAAIYVAPTQYETFGYTILEAMSCGVPVVACRVGAVPELVDDGDTGLLAPPADPAALGQAILTLLGDPAGRARFGQRARDKVIRQYAVPDIAASMLAWYEQVCRVP